MLPVPSLMPHLYLASLPILGVLLARPTVHRLSLLLPLNSHWPHFPMPDQQQAVLGQHLCALHLAHTGPQTQPNESIWGAAAPWQKDLQWPSG